MQLIRRNACGLLSRLLFMVVLASALLLPVSAWADGKPDPRGAQALVKETTEALLDVLREQAAAGEIDVDVLRDKVDRLVEPHLDFITMTRLAVGRHWRDATDDQKRSLVNEFRELLVRTYSNALEQVEEYDGQRIEFLPMRETGHADRVEVRSKVIQPSGPEIPVSYGLRYTNGEWKLYDIVVDGISLVTTYRSGFSSVVRRDGIDGLIRDLEKKNEQGEAEVPDIDAG